MILFLVLLILFFVFFFFFSSRRRHTRWTGDWSSDVCSSDLGFPDFQVPTYPGLRLALPRAREIARRIEAAKPDAIHIDRKSTRLNSSHPSISYAVFCLKKKKNNIQ